MKQGKVNLISFVETIMGRMGIHLLQGLASLGQFSRCKHEGKCKYMEAGPLYMYTGQIPIR